MERTKPVTPTEPVKSPLESEMLGLCQRYRRLAWLAGVLAVAAVGLSAWLMVELTVRCTLRGAGSPPMTVSRS